MEDTNYLIVNKCIAIKQNFFLKKRAAQKYVKNAIKRKMLYKILLNVVKRILHGIG